MLPEERRGLSDDQVQDLIGQHGIVAVRAFNPAAVDFELGDGRVLTMYDGDREYPRTWWVA